jgi:hypothetical protein
MLASTQNIFTNTMQTVKIQHQEFDLFTTYFEVNSDISDNINIILNEANPQKGHLL